MKLIEIDKYSVASCMHVALRKLCDSTATSALWNAIHVLGGEHVNPFWDAVTEALQEHELSHHAALAMEVKRAWRSVEYAGDPGKALLHCLGELLDDDDWQNFTAFLVEED